MSKKVNGILIVLLIAGSFAFGISTLLFEENFNYTAGDKLTDHGWSRYTTDSTPTINVVSPGLSFVGYQNSGIGNAIQIDTSGEDIRRYLSGLGGTVYTAFMVKVTKATGTGDYFFAFQGPLDDSIGRIYIQDNSGNFEFGLSKYTDAPIYTSNLYSLETTYVVVMKYEFIAGANNDEVSLFIFDPNVGLLPVTEPVTPDIGPLSPANNDPPYLVRMCLYQGDDISAPRLFLDGMRIDTSWAAVIPPIPTLNYPTNDSILSNPDTVRFSWNAVAEADSYNIVVKKEFGWVLKESMPPLPPIPPPIKQHIKEGGALVGVSNTKSNSSLYAFRGTKTNNFQKYIIDVSLGEWLNVESIPYGYKYPSNPTAINKKYPNKGAAFCFDGDHTIYATRGGGTCEFWAYNVAADTWIAKPYFPFATKAFKGGSSLAFKDGKVYALVGGAKVGVNNFFVYDTLYGIWDTLRKVPLEPDNKRWKDGSCLSVLGESLYALKGGGKHNCFYRYDILSNEWFVKESMPKCHPQLPPKKKTTVKDGGAMTNDGEKLYAIKGGGKQDFWAYTPGELAGWTPLDTIPRLHSKSVPKTGAALAYAFNKIWLLKGNKTPEFWAYNIPDSLVKGYSTEIDENTSNTDATTTELGEGSYCWKVGSFEGDVLSDYSEEWKFEITKDMKTGKVRSIIVLTPASKKATITSNFNFDIAPNPFTKFTTINYSVPISGNVSIKLYNSSGRLIKTLVNELQNAGLYSLEIRNSLLKIPSGVYFLKYESTTNNRELKLIVQ